jgi:hypothetical protein
VLVTRSQDFDIIVKYDHDIKLKEIMINIKNAVFWDVAPCGSYGNRGFRGTHCLYFQVAAATCSRWFLARRFFCLEARGDTFL